MDVQARVAAEGLGLHLALRSRYLCLVSAHLQEVQITLYTLSQRKYHRHSHGYHHCCRFC
jgi:hypothetical protein